MFEALNELTPDSILMPLDYLFSHWVKISDSYIACDGPQFVGKARMRLNSFSGLFDIVFVYAYSFLTQKELALLW